MRRLTGCMHCGGPYAPVSAIQAPCACIGMFESQCAICPAVKQCDNPTDEEVDRVHALVVEALVQLYERYKHLVPGWETRHLLIK